MSTSDGPVRLSPPLRVLHGRPIPGLALGANPPSITASIASSRQKIAQQFDPGSKGDIASLPLIERSAAAAFRSSPHAWIADDEVMPVEFYPPHLARGTVWVAELGGELAGFTVGQVYADALHLWEVAVRHDRQGRGLGRRLVDKEDEFNN